MNVSIGNFKTLYLKLQFSDIENTLVVYYNQSYEALVVLGKLVSCILQLFNTTYLLDEIALVL